MQAGTRTPPDRPPHSRRAAAIVFPGPAGYVGELTQQVPFEMADAVLKETCRVRDLPGLATSEPGVPGINRPGTPARQDKDETRVKWSEPPCGKVMTNVLPEHV